MASVVVLRGKDIINHFDLFSVTLVLNPIRWQGYPGKERKKKTNQYYRIDLEPSWKQLLPLGIYFFSTLRSVQTIIRRNFLCGANHLITIFVALGSFSLCFYLLPGYPTRDILSNEATTKYLFMGGASSFIQVFGVSSLWRDHDPLSQPL